MRRPNTVSERVGVWPWTEAPPDTTIATTMVATAHHKFLADPHPQNRRMAGSSFSHSLCVHRLEELGVALGVAQLVEQEVDGVHRSHRIEDAAQHVHFLE